MKKFIINFSRYNGNFEFTINNYGEISKSLFYFKNNDYFVILDYLENIFGLDNLFRNIFDIHGDKINHIGYDSLNNKYKFYINLYDHNFEDSLKIIKDCKIILGIKDKYYLEKDFLKFDCIGFDISENGINMKIYEIIKKDENFLLLPDFIKNYHVKEIGYLKNFSGRKKLFIRFENHMSLDLFKNIFDFSNIDSFKKEIKDFYILENKVKYYCFEGNKKELYII